VTESAPGPLSDPLQCPGDGIEDEAVIAIVIDLLLQAL
jgi:hypothetical protein